MSLRQFVRVGFFQEQPVEAYDLFTLQATLDQLSGFLPQTDMREAPFIVKTLSLQESIQRVIN